MSQVRIEWPHGGDHVLLAGSFNQWRGEPMRKDSGKGGLWYDTVLLGPGVHQFKFVVDGEWRYNRDVTLIDDRGGNVNNAISVDAGGVKKDPPAIQQKQQHQQYVPQPQPQPQPQSQSQPQPQPHPHPQQQQKQNQQQGKTQQGGKKGGGDAEGKKEAAPKDNQQKGGKGKGEGGKPKAEEPTTKGSEAKGKGEQKGKKDEKEKEGEVKKGKEEKEVKDSKTTKKEEKDQMHFVGHWEKIQINTVTGKELWWQYVQSPTDDPSRIPLRRRYPPDCVSCSEKVLVEDDVFSRYGVEWQPLCLKCYAAGNGVPLVNVNKPKPTQAKPYCHWCHEEAVVGQSCSNCQEYVSRVLRDFGLSRTEAYTNLYYFNTALRKTRPLPTN